MKVSIMKSCKKNFSVHEFIGLMLGCSLFFSSGCPAQAQFGPGAWQEIMPTGKVDKSQRAYVHFENHAKDYVEFPWKQPGTIRHFVEEYTYQPDTQTETFRLIKSQDNHRRVEFRGPDYEQGTYQFEGELKIDDAGTDDIWVAQLWHAVLIKYRRDKVRGKLIYHAANAATGEAAVPPQVLAEDIFGKWVKLNMIHSGAPSFDIYLYLSVDGVPVNNGQPFKFKTFDADGNFYIKYGAYNGPGQEQLVHWRKTRIWKQTAPGN